MVHPEPCGQLKQLVPGIQVEKQGLFLRFAAPFVHLLLEFALGRLLRFRIFDHIDLAAARGNHFRQARGLRCGKISLLARIVL